MNRNMKYRQYKGLDVAVASAAGTDGPDPWPVIFAQFEANIRGLGGQGEQAACVEVAAPARAPVRRGPMTMLIADAGLCHRSLSAGIASMGGCCITAHHLLEAIISLQNDCQPIDVILAPAYDPRFHAMEFFRFVKDEFPLVRLVAYASDASERADALSTGLLDVVLTYPMSLQELVEALLPVPVATPGARGVLISIDKIDNEKPMQASLFGYGMASQMPLRILVADDSQINQRLILSVLGHMGYCADLAQNGREALTALRNNGYDVVLMDIDMPEMDGVEATLVIRTEFPRCEQPQIVAVTANVGVNDRVRCIDSGMNDHVRKPISASSLGFALEGCYVRLNQLKSNQTLLE